LAEWLYEAGIGENRAILVEDDCIIEARIEWPGLRAGTVADARLAQILITGRRGLATLAGGEEVLVEPLDRTTEGGTIGIEIIRETISEPGAVKRAKGRITDAAPCEGPALDAQIGAHRVVGPRDPDRFETSGWSELLEQAASGIIPFDGGAVRISLTPAMTLIDVDGTLPPLALALAGAKAAAEAIRAFGIGGNIGIDLPTIGGKAERAAVAQAFDTVLPKPFERTAVNGFGFLQLIRPRVRPSILELIQYEPARSAACALMRRAQRANLIGATEIVAHQQVIDVLKQNSDWLDGLERQNGGPLTLQSSAMISINSGTINRIG
jgi:ribonuclease G